MTSHINPIRAIGSEFLLREWKGMLFTFSIVSVVFVVICTWLISLSAWWWLFTFPVFCAIILGYFGLFIARFIIGVVSPNLTDTQRTAVVEFVDKLERVAEKAQTPPFWIAFKVIRDVIWPRNTSFIQEMTKDGTSLSADYKELLKFFTV